MAVAAVCDRRRFSKQICVHAAFTGRRYRIFEAYPDIVSDLKRGWGAAFTPLQRCQHGGQSLRSLRHESSSGLKGAPQEQSQGAPGLLPKPHLELQLRIRPDTF